MLHVTFLSDTRFIGYPVQNVLCFENDTRMYPKHSGSGNHALPGCPVHFLHWKHIGDYLTAMVTSAGYRKTKIGLSVLSSSGAV